MIQVKDRMEMEPRWTAGKTTTTTTSTRACRSHSEAERRRRQRINGHLATLRTLLPAATRMDKATLLGEVVRHVRELRGIANNAAVVIPTEKDEVRIEEYGSERVRARICCEDRPGLMGDLDRAVRSTQAKAVRAEIVTIGGRTRSELEVEVVAGESLSSLHAALRAVSSGSADFLGDNYNKPLPALFSQFVTS